MPQPLPHETGETLLHLVHAALKRTEALKEADVGTGWYYQVLLGEYNELISKAVKILGQETAQLFRPFDLRHFPSPREVSEKQQQEYFDYGLTSFNQLI